LSSLLDGADGTALARGTRGEAVQRLKDALAAWYAKHAAGEYERFRVRSGPTFGTALERAVRDFQARVGLVPDGVAGPKTIDALSRDARPRNR
jgi:murein L,D-transpeptidase YcbB/YkuD